MLELLAAQAAVPTQWQTKCERTNFVETSRYEETIEFCRRLAAESPYAELQVIGKSPQGRDVVVLILSKENAFNPGRAKASRKPLMFFNNGIHSGEIEGKDASLMLARDILITKKEAKLLDHANLIFVPIFSVDAHERFTPYSRVNQNGPKEMGWRTTAINLNLNRDYVKADTMEMQAEVKFLADWRPDVFFDNHTTDGGDWQYVMTYDTARWPTQDADVMDFSGKLDSHLMKAVNDDSFVTGPYFGGFNQNQPQRGASLGTYSPRFSHGYYHLFNRPAILVETHVLKPYKPRVLSTYSIMKRAIEFCGENADELNGVIRTAEARERMLKEGDEIVTSARTSQQSRPWTFMAYEFTPYESPITGNEVRAWDHSKPLEISTVIRDRFEPAGTTTLPHAYLIPAQWKEVIARLDMHGISYQKINFGKGQVEFKAPVTVFENVAFGDSAFEGRFMPRFEMVQEERTVTIPSGSVIVPVNQPGIRLVVHMLEPQFEDSLMKWGFFNNVFTQTEYFEDYAMEPIAKKMLAENPELRREFEERLKDPEFAGNARARLQFFYNRSPYYDQTFNVYPVLRLSEAQLKELRLK